VQSDAFELTLFTLQRFYKNKEILLKTKTYCLYL